MKDRVIQCEHYVYEGGLCAKRTIPCHFWKEMQKCGKYSKKPGANAARADYREKKKNDFMKKVMRGEY